MKTLTRFYNPHKQRIKLYGLQIAKVINSLDANQDEESKLIIESILKQYKPQVSTRTAKVMQRRLGLPALYLMKLLKPLHK